MFAKTKKLKPAPVNVLGRGINETEEQYQFRVVNTPITDNKFITDAEIAYGYAVVTATLFGVQYR